MVVGGLQNTGVFFEPRKHRSFPRMNREDLSAMKRRDLQMKAKELGIKANQASSVLIQQILEMSDVDVVLIVYE